MAGHRACYLDGATNLDHFMRGVAATAHPELGLTMVDGLTTKIAVEMLRNGTCQAAIVTKTDFQAWQKTPDQCDIEAIGSNVGVLWASWLTNQESPCVSQALDYWLQEARDGQGSFVVNKQIEWEGKSPCAVVSTKEPDLEDARVSLLQFSGLLGLYGVMALLAVTIKTAVGLSSLGKNVESNDGNLIDALCMASKETPDKHTGMRGSSNERESCDLPAHSPTASLTSPAGSPSSPGSGPGSPRSRKYIEKRYTSAKAASRHRRLMEGISIEEKEAIILRNELNNLQQVSEIKSARTQCYQQLQEDIRRLTDMQHDSIRATEQLIAQKNTSMLPVFPGFSFSTLSCFDDTAPSNASSIVPLPQEPQGVNTTASSGSDAPTHV